MPSILIVDDNESVRLGLCECFAQRKFDVYQAASGKQALEQVAAKKPSVIIMDLGLPDQSGFDVVETIKKDPATCGIPILVFTAYHKDGQLIESKEHGADGYLIKGGPWEEVLGYVDLLIKSSSLSVMDSITLGQVKVGLTDRTVQVAGQPAPPMTPKEFDLLVFLLQKSPEVLPWEKIAKAVWGASAKYGRDSKTIELHAQRVRRKLGPEAGKCMLTHKGVGLQFLSSLPAVS